MSKYLNRLPLLLCYLLVFALSIKSMREPDLWWQIRTGEWILQHHEVPHQDVFSFTYNGTPWVNIKWGFEVLAALISQFSGPESIFILQAIISCLLVFFLVRAAKLSLANGGDEYSPVFILALLFTIIAIEYRLIGRPEMFSHLFTVVFLFVLLQHHKAPSNKIFILVPLQLVWANFHEAFGIGLVLIGIFLAGAWLEYFLQQRKAMSGEARVPKEITALLLVALVSVVINPNGITLLTKPLNILGQVYENKFTTELLGIGAPEYWHWNVYLTCALLLLGIGGTVLHFTRLKTKGRKLTAFVECWGIGYLLALVAFLYLAATAYRNIIFLLLVFFPMLVFGMEALIAKPVQKMARQLTIALLVLQVSFYALVVTNKYYELSKGHDRFGLEVLSTYNPVGAAQFIKANNLSGPCFSDYLTSSYLLWSLQPDFKTFIDLRDLDVFPSAFFSTFAEAVTFPESFEKLDSTYHFNYVVLYRPQFADLHDHLYNESNFKLAFVDDVAAVYVRKNISTTTPVIEKAVRNSFLSTAINATLNPLYKPYNYNSVDNNFLMSSYYNTVGQTDTATVLAMRSATNGPEKYNGLEMLGEIMYNRAVHAGTAELRAAQLDSARTYYALSLEQKVDEARTYLGLGAVYFQQKNMSAALENFDKCIALDKTNLNAYSFAAEVCKYYVNQNNGESNAYAKQAITYYRKADKLNPDNPNITLNLGFLYSRLNDCDNAVKYLQQVVDFQGLSPQQKAQAKDCLRRCGR